MGWSSGSELMSRVIASMVLAGISSPQRTSAYRGIIEAFRNDDCDTLDECFGEDPAFDEAFDNPESSSDAPSKNYCLPPALWKACCDPFDYAIKLRTGEVYRFSDARMVNSEWVRITGLANFHNPFPEGFNFDRGLEVRLSDIVWVADAPAGS